MIGAERRLVFQPCPRNRRMLLTHPEESAKAKHRIGYAPADLINHQPLTSADLFPIGSAHRRSFHSVAGDQGVRPCESLCNVSPCMIASIRLPTAITSLP